MEDCDQRKVFVGGISWETTEDVLREHFGRYGRVMGTVIAKDRITGTSRGFAFVSFSDASPLNTVLLDTHNILGRTVEVKKAVPRSEQNHNHQEQNRGLNRNNTSGTRSNDNIRTKKIFVGGLSANLTEDDFKIYFEKFGKITDVVVMHDNVTHRPRGFGFITFDSEDSVEDVMQKSFHELSGKLVEVKRAVPKNDVHNKDSNFSSFQHGCYLPYSPRYEVLSGYPPVHGYGGYPVYPFSRYGPGPVSYGLGPVGPWIRGGPYGGPTGFYPGVMGMVANGYNGFVGYGKPSQLGGGDERVGGDVVDNNSLSLSGAETSERGQSAVEVSTS